MKRMIAVLTVLCLLCACCAALAEAPAAAAQEKLTLGNGVQFGMSQAEVTAIAGTPNETDREDVKGQFTFTELEYKNVAIPLFDNATIDVTYLFVSDKLVAVRFDFDARSMAYEAVKEAVATKGESVALDYALLGNGIYAVDDDGTPELNALAYIDEAHNVLSVIEADGDDIEITVLDLSADYIR